MKKSILAISVLMMAVALIVSCGGKKLKEGEVTQEQWEQAFDGVILRDTPASLVTKADEYKTYTSDKGVILNYDDESGVKNKYVVTPKWDAKNEIDNENVFDVNFLHNNGWFRFYQTGVGIKAMMQYEYYSTDTGVEVVSTYEGHIAPIFRLCKDKFDSFDFDAESKEYSSSSELYYIVSGGDHVGEYVEDEPGSGVEYEKVSLKFKFADSKLSAFDASYTGGSLAHHDKYDFEYADEYVIPEFAREEINRVLGGDASGYPM